MPDRLSVGIIIGLAIVAGPLLVVWYRGRLLTRVVDDPSILLAAPPSGLTPATAVVIDGGQTHRAYTTALLDLASRDEIAFVEEGVTDGRADLGIAVHDGPTTDSQALLNRRQPAGEGETWLLGQLRVAADEGDLGFTDPMAEMARVAAVMGTAPALLGALAREHAQTPEEEESASAREARMDGLLSGGPIDVAAMASAYEAKTGHPLPPETVAALAAMTRPTATSPSGAADPTDAADSADAATDTHGANPLAGTSPPDAASSADAALPFTTAIPSGTAPASVGAPLSLLATRTGADADATSAAAPRSTAYIAAHRARTLQALLFGTAVQAYAKRHGWIGWLPVVPRLLWHAVAVLAGIAGIIVMSGGVSGYSDLVTGVGVGLLGGAILAWFAAPHMTHPTKSGALVRAQLAAYRRTLQQTFATAASLDDVTGPGGLRWLATSSEALVWGVAVGLDSEIAALLSRTSPPGSSPVALPLRIRLRRRTTGDHPDTARRASPAELFAGIEAIGSQRAGAISFTDMLRR